MSVEDRFETLVSLECGTDSDLIIFTDSKIGYSPDCYGCPYAKEVTDLGREALDVIKREFVTTTPLAEMQAIRLADVKNNPELQSLLVRYLECLDQRSTFSGAGDCSSSYEIYRNGKLVGQHCGVLDKDFYKTEG